VEWLDEPFAGPADHGNPESHFVTVGVDGGHPLNLHQSV
jgi:hypothetical protein